MKNRIIVGLSVLSAGLAYFVYRLWRVAVFALAHANSVATNLLAWQQAFDQVCEDNGLDPDEEHDRVFRNAVNNGIDKLERLANDDTTY